MSSSPIITIQIDLNRPLAAAQKDLEKIYLAHVLSEARGNKAQAARMAGLSYQAFRNKLALYKISSFVRLIPKDEAASTDI